MIFVRCGETGYCSVQYRTVLTVPGITLILYMYSTTVLYCVSNTVQYDKQLLVVLYSMSTLLIVTVRFKVQYCTVSYWAVQYSYGT